MDEASILLKIRPSCEKKDLIMTTLLTFTLDMTYNNIALCYSRSWGVVSWLEHSSPDQVVKVCALAEDTVLCSCARHLTLTVPLSTDVYKW